MIILILFYKGLKKHLLKILDWQIVIGNYSYFEYIYVEYFIN